MGDVNTAVERSLVERAQLPDVELLVVGHHGSKSVSYTHLAVDAADAGLDDADGASFELRCV